MNDEIKFKQYTISQDELDDTMDILRNAGVKDATLELIEPLLIETLEEEE